MTVMLEHPITPEWRTSVLKRMEDLDIKAYALARLVGTSQAAITHVLTRGKSSALVPRIDLALATATRQPKSERPEPQEVAEIAALRESRDAIQSDIVRLEDVRAAVEERLAEAYERRAQLDVRIRELRGSPQ